MGVCGFEHEPDSHRARLSADNTSARKEVVLEPTELKSRDQYHRVDLRLTRCDWHQYLEMEQWGEDMFDLVDGIRGLDVGMEREGDHTRLASALCEVTNRVRNQGKPVQANSMPRVKVWSAKETARPGPE